MLIYFVHISFESFSQFNYYASLLFFFFSSLFVIFFFAFVIIYIANDVRIGDDWTLFVCVHFRHLSFYHFVEIYFGVRVPCVTWKNAEFAATKFSFYCATRSLRLYGGQTQTQHNHTVCCEYDVLNSSRRLKYYSIRMRRLIEFKFGYRM